MSSFKLKLEISVQNQRGLMRRYGQARRGLEESQDKINAIRAQINDLTARVESLESSVPNQQENLKSIGDYYAEVADQTRKLFYESLRDGTVNYSPAQQDELYGQFLVKHKIGDGK